MIKIEIKLSHDANLASILLNIDNQAWQTICDGVTIAESVEKIAELKKAIPFAQVWINGKLSGGF